MKAKLCVVMAMAVGICGCGPRVAETEDLSFKWDPPKESGWRPVVHYHHPDGYEPQVRCEDQASVLNAVQEQGWQLVAVNGDTVTVRREKQEGYRFFIGWEKRR